MADKQSNIGYLRMQKGDVRFVIQFHLCFAFVAVGGLALVSSGDNMVLLLVLGWHGGMLTCLWHRRGLLWEIYEFSAVTSIFQVLPDWFLVKVLGTLQFPAKDGLYKVGDAVTCYMAGMWAIPFFIIISSSLLIADWSPPPRQKFSSSSTTAPRASHHVVGYYTVSSIIALLIFGTSEFLLYYLDLWHCTHTVQHRLLGHVAVYVLPAEAILGPTLLHGFQSSHSTINFEGRTNTNSSASPAKVWMSGMTTLCYTGALAISFLFIEGSVDPLFI